MQCDKMMNSLLACDQT